MRFVEQGYARHKHLIDQCDTHVFVHTWYEPAMIGQPFQPGYDKMKGCLEPTTLQTMVKLYQPYDMVLEPRKTFDTSWCYVGPYSVFPENMLAMFYGINRVQKQRSLYDALGSDYDLVARARFDSVFNGDLDLNSLDPSFIHVHNQPKHTPYSISDQFAVGGSELMNHYGEVYNNLQHYNAVEGIPLCGEVMLGYALQKAGVPIQEHDWTDNLTLIRG